MKLTYAPLCSRGRRKSAFIWFVAFANISPPQAPSACCRGSCLETRKICMSDIACVRRAQDIGFCGMSDMSDIASGEKHILFFPQNNVRRVRHPTKTIVLGTSDASSVRYAHLRAFRTHTRNYTFLCVCLKNWFQNGWLCFCTWSTRQQT